ncbi:MAG TPA: hypothetical protein VFS21_22255 [Roseiflexaceae bacterium]|nr:hypothetical protein [Roseiflexaceae bacterium]
MSQDIDLDRMLPGRSAVAQDLALGLAALALTALVVWQALRPPSPVPAALPAAQPVVARSVPARTTPAACLPGKTCTVPDEPAATGAYHERDALVYINDRLISGLVPLEEFDRAIAEAQAERP